MYSTCIRAYLIIPMQGSTHTHLSNPPISAQCTGDTLTPPPPPPPVPPPVVLISVLLREADAVLISFTDIPEEGAVGVSVCDCVCVCGCGCGCMRELVGSWYVEDVVADVLLRVTVRAVIFEVVAVAVAVAEAEEGVREEKEEEEEEGILSSSPHSFIHDFPLSLCAL